MILKQSVGIDISKDHFHACLSVINSEQQIKIKGTRKFTNTPAGFEELIKWVNKKRQADIFLYFVMEATGTYYEQLAWHLYEKEETVSVVLPKRAKRYLQATGQKSKNDTIDSKGLAQMGAEQALKHWKPLNKKIYRLRMLTREQERLQAQKVMLMNTLHALSYGMFEVKQTKKRLEKQVKLFEQLIEEVKNEIIKEIERDQELRERVEKICQIKGVSVLTVAILIAETNGFALVENQAQLVSYAGYDVTENQSGLRTGKTRISKKGNAHIRRCMHMPAYNMVRYQVPPFQALYDRLIERGKTKMQAYVAIQKKLLVIIWTLWKKNEAFDPEYMHQMTRELN